MKRSFFLYFLLRCSSLFSQNPSSFTWETQDGYPCIQLYSTDATQANYLWSFNDLQGSQSTLQDPLFCFADTGCYTIKLWVQDVNGNADSTTQTICIHNESALFIPNAFSPNGDSHNDVFFAEGYLIAENKFEMFIYDCWGGLVFASYDIHHGWDGRPIDGYARVQNSTYLVEMAWNDSHNKRHTYRGYVWLLY